MARTIAEERIPARMPTAVYNRLVEAAQSIGATLNQFIVQSALEKANAILEEERTIKLSAAAANALFTVMENPPEPNEYLKNAMKRRGKNPVPEIIPLDQTHNRSGFDCGVPELNAFLKATARQHSQKGISRTFVLTAGTPAILGFFTLTLCELHTQQLPTSHARKYPLHGLPAVRLARLAVSRREQGNGYGELLLAEAVHRTAIIAEQAGVIGLFVDAKNEVARRFYERYGFLPIPEHPLQLFLPIETVRAAR